MIGKLKKCHKCGGTAFKVSISDSCENCPENKNNQAEFTGECCMGLAYGVGCHVYRCIKCGQVEHWPTLDE